MHARVNPFFIPDQATQTCLRVGLERLDEGGERQGAGAGQGHLLGAADEAVLLPQVRRRVGVHPLRALVG